MENRIRGTRIVVRLTNEDANQFKAQCALEGNTMQNVLERLIRNFLKELKEKPE